MREAAFWEATVELSYFYVCRKCGWGYAKTFGTYSIVTKGTRQRAVCPQCGASSRPQHLFVEDKKNGNRWKRI
jgi:predicted RNA-binding Zn-ribbon protein involved in translation (DUF1610 family)